MTALPVACDPTPVASTPRLVVVPRHRLHGDADLADLSPREVDVMRLVTNCYSNQEISETLYLSLNSVKTYIRGAYRKIGAPTRSHAVVWGVQHGLLEEPDVEPELRAVN